MTAYDDLGAAIVVMAGHCFLPIEKERIKEN